MTYTVLRILTYVLGIVGTALALPLGVALWRGESRMVAVFAVPMALAWISSLVFLVKARGRARVIGIQDAFSVVGTLWMVICLFGSLPLYFSGSFASFTDALFESVSGFTTTGATVLPDVESLPASVNVWRCLSHWLGGLGVVALGVAMIPLLGAGGFRLVKAEASGPDKGKFTASIASTAKALWFVYAGFTALQAWLLHDAGLGWIDSFCHAFSTLSTGGFSTRNASVGAFGSVRAEWICTVFMLLGTVNFAMYCKLLSGRLSEVAKNTELRVFLTVVSIAAALVASVEATSCTAFGDVLRNACFQVASVISSTGFMTSDYTSWLPASQIVVLTLFLIGGCAGSTAGGVKIIRWTMLAKQLANEMRRLVHPYGVFTLRINGVPGRETFIPTVAAFVFVYLIIVLLTTFAGALCGLDPLTALTAALSMVGNIGPAFGSLGPSSNYGGIPDFLKWWYMVAMLAGRLEIYTLLFVVRGFSLGGNGTGAGSRNA